MFDQLQPRLRRNSRKGNSLIELSLLMPRYFFLFVGAYDFGFYAYGLIALEDGVRVATLNASQNSSLAGNSSTACTYVLGSLVNLPNIGSGVSTCSASPITVTATYGATSGPETTVIATYTSPQLIPIPGVLPGQVTITRSLRMRVQ
jgi:Flp pilus assembly protein TadG